MTAKTSEDTVTADKEFYYNRETGKVTIMSKTFSPFTYVFDSNATVDRSGVVYPAGVTTTSFPESVSYTTWTGGSATAPATAAYIDNSGAIKYVADITDAIQAGATTVYVKEGVAVSTNRSSQTNRTTDLTSDLTIYANGANFQYGEVSVNMTNDGKKANITLKIYDAQNIKVWGTSPNANVTQNIILENCHNKGTAKGNDPGEMVMLYPSITGTINITLKNCSISQTNTGVVCQADGAVTIESCTFSEVNTGVKIHHKGTGTSTVNIKNSTFTGCGSATDDDGAAIKLRTNKNQTMKVTLTNVAVTDTVATSDTKPAIWIGEGENYGSATVNAKNVTIDGKAWTYSAG